MLRKSFKFPSPLQLGRHSDCVRDCTSALDLSPDYQKATLRRAQSNLELGAAEEAVRDYEAAHKRDRANPEIRRYKIVYEMTFSFPQLLLVEAGVGFRAKQWF